jgi:hypothetical protein
MKTSNKLVLVALLLTLVSLCYYNYLLKKAFISGKYKDPYANFVTLKFKDFDTIDVVSSTAANIKFVQGPFSVRIDTNFMDYAKVRQTGGRLQINAVFESGYLYNPNPYVLVISCPKLSQVIANATYQANNKTVTDTIVREDWNMRQVLIDGFKQDSLSIRQDYGSTVVFANNNIKWLNVATGKSKGSGSKTIVLKRNQFGEATFNIGNNSKLVLNDATINKLDYHLADSTQIIFNGAAKNKFKN